MNPWDNKNDSNLLNLYNGQAIPLLIFINQNNEEIDRIVGFYPPNEYLPMIKDIYNGKGTFLFLKNKYKDQDITSAELSELAMKCGDNRDLDFCEDVYLSIVNSSEVSNKDVLFKAELFFVNKNLSSGKILPAINLLNRYKDNINVIDLYNIVIRYFSNEGDISSEANFYKSMTDTFQENPSILNGYAWRMTELGLNLEDALQKSDLAIELTKDIKMKSYILDTKAEVLWLLGRAQDALNTIDLAINIDPNSDYFREQREKFKISLK